MASMIQIRNVPDDLHRRIKARAATAGMSMSEYLLRELRRIIERPTRDELLARIARRSRVSVHPEPAEVIREERKRR
jgi:plasmid stability protein